MPHFPLQALNGLVDGTSLLTLRDPKRVVSGLGVNVLDIDV